MRVGRRLGFACWNLGWEGDMNRGGKSGPLTPEGPSPAPGLLWELFPNLWVPRILPAHALLSDRNPPVPHPRAPFKRSLGSLPPPSPPCPPQAGRGAPVSSRSSSPASVIACHRTNLLTLPCPVPGPRLKSRCLWLVLGKECEN